MQRVRFNSRDSFSSFPAVQYETPSLVDELKIRIASQHETVDSVLEEGLQLQISRFFRIKHVRVLPHSAELPGEPGWTAYIARFLIHFVKGIFVGVGMYTMDMLLITGRLQNLIFKWRILRVGVGGRGGVMDSLGWIATGATLGFFASNALQAYRIALQKSVGDLSFYQFGTTYLKYPTDPAISVVNGVGASIAFLSMCIYYGCCNDRADVERKALQVLAIIFAVFFAARVGLMPPSWVGLAAMIASIVMFASPLIALRNIMRKRDSSVLSMPTIIMTLAVSASWTSYGIAKSDTFVILPNSLGGLLGLAQLYIYFKYRPGQKSIIKDRSSYDALTSP